MINYQGLFLFFNLISMPILFGALLIQTTSLPGSAHVVKMVGGSNPNVAPGVLKQLSDMYPGLRINIPVETVPGIIPKTGSQIAIINGQKAR
ncbi:hypothetical protein ACO0LL_22875 [Undibacterium sp. TC4M20W]|uniref:hypothetical protein n=1 Tax=Undibacterium sp. TC4M20W TaxID=3413052 RepID=UPI003BF2073A